MDIDLCQYKDIFGVPGEGVHAERFYGVATVDLVATIVAAIAIAILFKQNLLQTVAILFLLGIIMHRLFCVRTAVDKFLFHC
jgi:hypothetical protein